MTRKQYRTTKKPGMGRWYVEYWTYGKRGYMTVDAVDGKAAIEEVNKRVIGATSFKVFRDDEEE